MNRIKAADVSLSHRIVERTDRGTIKSSEAVVGVMPCTDFANVHITTTMPTGKLRTCCYVRNDLVEIV